MKDTAFPRSDKIGKAVARCEAHAPFLREAIRRHPALVTVLASEGAAAALAAAQAAGREIADVAAQLRIERSGTALVLALSDLGGLYDLRQTLEQLTSFADSALDRAIREAMRERTGATEPVGFAAVALGKQGSRELNYSSDIDPIFLYDPPTLPRRPREDAGQAAVRIARRVVELLQARTGDGYVLRVDLRLRPSPEVFPIALPVEAAVTYYETSALPWERAAFIRARAAAGDIALGKRFLAAVQPFVWRRSLDYGAVEEISGISRQIREAGSHDPRFGPGYDLKRARGGIREVEFFAQIHQLIHGGRDPSLRSPATLDALAALAHAGRVEGKTASALGKAYRVLRTIEHRLQMVEDQQTHSLPHGEALDSVAGLHGLDDGAALLELLAPHVAVVAEAYDRLAGEEKSAPRLASGEETLEEELRGKGFADPKSAAGRIAGWRRGGARSLRSPAARSAFEAMLPGLVDAVAQVPDPIGALNRFDNIVSALPSGINLYRLLDARPGLVGLLALILGHAPALAEQLARRPELLDGLIDASSLDLPPEVAALAAYFKAGAPDRDFEAVLDAVRRRVNEWRFALGVQLIARRADPLQVGAGYARVAEAALVALTGAVVGNFSTPHGAVPDSEFVIVSLGRLGGEVLTHASDLDLIYLFTGPIDAQSDGPRPLRATDYYNRLARRVTAALSTATAAGPLYDVDTRMRPSGIHGMLAVSLDAFATYQRDEAWTFEHMALARARTVFGSPEARRDVDRCLGELLDAPRDRPKLLADASAMRAEIARHKPARGPLDVKKGDGGLIDLEFAVHVTQLACRRGLHAALSKAIEALVEDGLLPPRLIAAEQLLTRLLIVMRLVAPADGTPEPASQALVAGACGMSDWTRLVAEVSEARQVIADVWQRTLTEGLAC